MCLADQIIVHGRAHAAELRREADHARLTQGLRPQPWRPALAAQFRTLGRQPRSLPRTQLSTRRPGIVSSPILRSNP